jgi:hypothetical protein
MRRAAIKSAYNTPFVGASGAAIRLAREGVSEGTFMAKAY